MRSEKKQTDPKTYEVIRNLAPEGHKNCGYGCDSPHVVNCNCSGYYPKVCPRHKIQVVGSEKEESGG